MLDLTEFGLEQVGRGEAAIGAPALSHAEQFRFGREVVEAVQAPDGALEGEIARRKCIRTVERDQQESVHCPGTNTRDGGELRLDLCVGALRQCVVVELTVDKLLSKGSHRLDLAIR